ncbi:MAG: GumC family protein [Bryobacteraceae bacterium]
MSQPYQLLPGAEGPRPPALQPIPAAITRGEGYPTQGVAEANRLGDYVPAFKRRKLPVLAITLLGVLAALALSLTEPPTYRATASVEVEGLNENFLNLKDVYATENPTTGGSLEGTVDTELAALTEESLLQRVATELKLDRRPEFQPKPGMLARAKGWVGMGSAAGARPDAGSAVAILKEHMLLETPKQGRIIRIQYEARDAALAAEVANTLAKTLIQQNLESRWNATKQIGEWLNPQLTELQRNLSESEERLQKYAQSEGLLITRNNESAGEQGLRLEQEELARARADRISRQSVYQAAVDGPPGVEAANADSGVLHENQIKLTDLRRQLAELSSVLKPENYKVARVQAQIAELEAAQQDELGRARQRMEEQYQAAQTREQLLTKTYSQQAALVSAQSIKTERYENLKREVEVNRQLYEAMVQKAKEAAIASAIRPSNIRMVTTAAPPARPFKPNVPLNLGIGLFVGLSCGIAYVVTASQLDRKLRAPGDAELYLNLPELGAIPGANRSIPRKLIGSNGDRRGFELVAWDEKMSVFSESFRATLTSLLFAGGAAASPGVFVVTSPLAGEGKTTVVSNLGAALAEIDRCVLLVDADLRGPELHRVFSLDNDRGLSTLLSDDRPLDGTAVKELIRQTHIPNLFVLTAGPTVDRVSSLLHTDRMAQLLARLRTTFDHVIVDAPPSLLFADARIVARPTDGVVLVLRANRTSWPTAQAAVQRLQMDGVPILGTVLNDWRPDADNDVYGYRNMHKYYSAR